MENTTQWAQTVSEIIGGTHNINDVMACISRVRISVHDTSCIDMERLHNLQALGIVKHGSVIQIVMGPQSDSYADSLIKMCGDA